MREGPLELAFRFWKPVGEGDAGGLARYCAPGEASGAGLFAYRSDEEPACHRVLDGDRDFLLYAAVHPILDPPDDAEVVAEIREPSGATRSFVLWYPKDRRIVVPFDPNAAIRAMWFERYMPAEKKTVLPQQVLSAYYSLRPLIPPPVKLLLRKLVAGNSDGAAASHLLSWPADSSLDVLLQLLLRSYMMARGVDTLPFVWFWPEAHPWAAVLTHDVETAAGLARVPHVIELERARKLVSSFNLVPRDYEVSGETLARIQDAGCEIGVHGYTHDGLMFSSWATFLERALKVNECGRRWGAAGFRSPATYRNLDWFDLLEFEYDSSVTDTAPYEPQPGGCASLFPYLVGGTVEMPMTLPQDHTLFGILGHTDASVWMDKIRSIRDSRGMACVLTHPDPGPGYLGHADNEERYCKVLDFIATSGAWTPLPRDLARWWRRRAVSDAGSSDLVGATVATVLRAEGRLRVVPPTAP